MFQLSQYQQVGLDPDLVTSELSQAAKEAGLDDREIAATFESAWTAGTEKVAGSAAPFRP